MTRRNLPRPDRSTAEGDAVAPAALWIGVRAPGPLIVLLGGVTVAGLVSLWMAMQKAPDPRAALIPMLASNLGFGAVSGLLGPLVFVPTLAVVNTLAFTIHVRKRMRPLVFVAGLSTFLVPLALELVGTRRAGRRRSGIGRAGERGRSCDGGARSGGAGRGRGGRASDPERATTPAGTSA